MPIPKKKNRSNRLSQSPDKGSGKRVEATAEQAGLGRVQGRASAGASSNAISLVLKPSTKILNGLQVATLQGHNQQLADPSEQLKCIADLYPIISKIDGFKENKKWNVDSLPADVLHHLLKQFEKISKIDNWSVDHSNGRYTIKAIEFYGDGEFEIISVDFLAKINVSHPKLHELLTYGLMLVSRYNQIQLFGEWVKTSETGTGLLYEYLVEREEWFDGEDEEDQFKYGGAIDYYGPKGVPAAYIKLLGKGATLPMFKKEFNAWRPFDEIETKCYPFLKSLLTLVETKQSIAPYCQQPYEQGEITPMDYMTVIWARDEEDMMFRVYCDHIDDWSQNGSSPFCWHSDISNPESTKQIRLFLDKVIDFFNKGFQMSLDMDSMLRGVTELPPDLKPKKKKQNGLLIDIII